MPDQQAAFNAPFFLHRIIPDFRRLGHNGDRSQFLKHQQKNLRKHDEREAGKKRKPAGPMTDANMSLAIHVLDTELALTQPSPSANAESAEIPLPSEGQQLKRLNTPAQELPSQQPNGRRQQLTPGRVHEPTRPTLPQFSDRCPLLGGCQTLLQWRDQDQKQLLVPWQLPNMCLRHQYLPQQVPDRHPLLLQVPTTCLGRVGCGSHVGEENLWWGVRVKARRWQGRS